MIFLSPNPDNTYKPKLLTQVRQAIRTRHYSKRIAPVTLLKTIVNLRVAANEIELRKRVKAAGVN